MRIAGWRLVRVRGDSMAPTLPAGGFALFKPAATLRPGDIVLARHPRFGLIVKAVRAIVGSQVHLRGLSASSTPAQRLGAVARPAVLGRLAWRLAPPGRGQAGSVRRPSSDGTRARA